MYFQNIPNLSTQLILHAHKKELNPISFAFFELSRGC
jgi:hypothetical protein